MSERGGLAALLHSPRHNSAKMVPYQGFQLSSRQSMGAGDSASYNSPDKQTNASSNLLQHMHNHSGATSLQSQMVDPSKRKDQHEQQRFSGQVRSNGTLDKQRYSDNFPKRSALETIQERRGQPLNGDESVADEEYIRSVDDHENIPDDVLQSNTIQKPPAQVVSPISIPGSPYQSLHYPPPPKLVTGLSFPDSREDGLSGIGRDSKFAKDNLGRSTFSMRDTGNFSRYSPRKSTNPLPTLAPEYEQVIKSTGLTSMSFSDRSIGRTFSRKTRVELTEHQPLNDSSEIGDSKHDHDTLAIRDLESLKLRRNRSIQPELMGDIGNVRVVQLLENLQKEIERIGKENQELENNSRILQYALDKRTESSGQNFLHHLSRLQQSLEGRMRTLNTRCQQIEGETDTLNKLLANESEKYHRLDTVRKNLRAKGGLCVRDEQKQEFNIETMKAVMNSKSQRSQTVVEVVIGQLSKIFVDSADTELPNLFNRADHLERLLGV